MVGSFVSNVPEAAAVMLMKVGAGCEPVSVQCSTAASSASPSPSREVSPKLAGETLRGRRRGFTASPFINCELAQQEPPPLDLFAQHFSHCQRLSDEYEGFEKLGEGSSAVVYKTRSRKNSQEEVAIKVMRFDDEEKLFNAQKEYELLKSVSHPHIIRALDFFTFSMGAVLVLDYFEGAKLGRAVRDTPMRHFEEATACRLGAQLLEAVAHLHSCGVIHRDVKADNVLVSHDLKNLCLVDFNAAKQLSESQALTMTGTVDYMPPEVLQGQSPCAAGDVWATGLCLYLMLYGQLPSERRALRISFDSMDEAVHRQGSLVRLDGERWQSISEPCKEVVLDCLQVCCELRPTASDILAKPWLTMAEATLTEVPVTLPVP